MLWELDLGRGRDLDAMMRRLKDLSAYALIHAEFWSSAKALRCWQLPCFWHDQ